MSMTTTARRVTHLAAIAVLAIAGLTATSTAASAFVAPPATIAFTGNGNRSSCNGFTLCVYADNNYKSFALGVVGGDLGETNLRNTNVLDRISSIVNNSTSAYCFWQDDDQSGLSFQIHRGEVWPSVPAYINDKISSWSVGQCFG